LFTLARACSDAAAGLPPFDPFDFMYMGRLTAVDVPDVHMYKHRWTRRYLNIDALGHAYRYVPSAHAGPDLDLGVDAPYVLIPDLRVALLHALETPTTARDGS